MSLNHRKQNFLIPTQLTFSESQLLILWAWLFHLTKFFLILGIQKWKDQTLFFLFWLNDVWFLEGNVVILLFHMLFCTFITLCTLKLKPHFYIYVVYITCVCVLRNILFFFFCWREEFDILEITSKLKIHVPLSHSSCLPHPTYPTYLAAAAKLLQSCPTLCDPIDSSPPGSPVPGILQAVTLEWVAISFSNAWKWKVKVKSLSRVRLLATSWTTAHQAPPSMEFSRQEYWSGLPLPSPRILS